MEELIEHPEDYGIYIVDRRLKGVDESVNQLTDYMYQFTLKTRRQRINQRNRTERLSPFLDWKVLGLEYVKARQLALRRAYPQAFDTDGALGAASFDESKPKVPRPISAPPSPHQGGATPGDMGSLQEGMEVLHTV